MLKLTDVDQMKLDWIMDHRSELDARHKALDELLDLANAGEPVDLLDFELARTDLMSFLTVMSMNPGDEDEES